MDHLRNQINIKQIVLISILVSVGVIFSLFDRMISSAAFAFLPNAKIGLANIVIVLGVYNFKFKETFLMVIMKSFLVGLIYGNPISFTISIIASIISFLGMYVAYKTISHLGSAISISVIGGFLHIVGQLLVVALVYRLGEAVAYYGTILIFVSLITSIIIGFISLRVLQFLKQKESSSN